jgi:hypothetical protein
MPPRRGSEDPGLPIAHANETALTKAFAAVRAEALARRPASQKS